MKNSRAFVAVLTLTGCTTIEPTIPVDYRGPTATLTDTGYQESSYKAAFFSLVELDGRTAQNSLRETRHASAGLGSTLVLRYTARDIPVSARTFKVIGTHETAAPIEELASRAAGTFFSIEGLVSFVPREGWKYIVTGSLAKENSCVWIAEAESKAPVTEKVCACMPPANCLAPVVQSKYANLGADLSAAPSTPTDAKAVFLNSSHPVLYRVTGSIQITINGIPIATLGIGEYIQLQLPPGTHEVELAHWDIFTFRSKHAIVVTLPNSYYELHATPISNRLIQHFRLPPESELPKSFRPYVR